MNFNLLIWWAYTNTEELDRKKNSLYYFLFLFLNGRQPATSNLTLFFFKSLFRLRLSLAYISKELLTDLLLSVTTMDTKFSGGREGPLNYNVGWLVIWVFWHFHLWRLFNAKSMFMQIVLFQTIQFSVSTQLVKKKNYISSDSVYSNSSNSANSV